MRAATCEFSQTQLILPSLWPQAHASRLHFDLALITVVLEVPPNLTL